MFSKRALKNRLVAKVVDGESGPCAFCRQTINDEVAFGKLYSIGDLYCHYFCVLLSCCLIQKGQDEQGLLGFLYTDIKAELERSKKHKCSFCGQEGATLGCSVSKCRKQFHMPCGRQKQAISLFFGNYKSFCSKHAPCQKIDANVLQKMRLRAQAAGKKAAVRAVMGIIAGDPQPEEEEEEADVCAICYEPVQGAPSAQTFWPPCCARDARFHRPCLERMALSAGIHYLRCPLCNDKDTFYQAVVAQGYYVPDRDAAWELEQNAFADIYQRDVSCNAETCRCPLGRGHDSENGAWDIKLCLLCGSCGFHADCLPPATARYICPTCLPAAPEDLEDLEAKILQIQEEQARAALASQATQPRRMMPSRMSLRRTKGAVVSTSRNWRLQAATAADSNNETVEEEKEDQSNTTASRSQLNLKTPKRYSRHLPAPADAAIPSADDETLASPLKYLRERLVAARATVDAEKMAETLRVRFKRPRPLSHKRKIVNAILNEILREGPKTRSPLKEWISPKKMDSTPKKKEKPTANAKRRLDSPKEVKTRTPSKGIHNTTPKRTPVKSPSTKTQDLDHDDSSNSTFQLPSEFVAEHVSDDDLPVFDTPKKCTTVDMQKDSSMEISNEEAKINIDLIKMDSEEASKVLKDVYVKSPERTVKCSYKFSPTDKEVLDKEDVGIDVESFKNRYLNEVVKLSQSCAYSHKHESKDASGNKLRTPIDFAVEAVKSKFLEVKGSDNVEGIAEYATKADDSMKGTEDGKKRRKLATKFGVDKITRKRNELMKRDRKKNRQVKKGVKRDRKSKPRRSKGSQSKDGVSTMPDQSDDDFETKRTSKKLKKKSKPKEERILRKLNKKQKKNQKYLLKCEKSRSSVKIKLVYNESDAMDDNCIDLTVESKKDTKIKKHRRSVSNKEINLKINFKSEQKKWKKSMLSPTTLQQTMLNFSPENASIKNCLVRPLQQLTPIKKRINTKREPIPLSRDSLKQTSIQNFFNKIKSPVKDEII